MEGGRKEHSTFNPENISESYLQSAANFHSMYSVEARCNECFDNFGIDLYQSNPMHAYSKVNPTEFHVAYSKGNAYRTAAVMKFCTFQNGLPSGICRAVYVLGRITG